MSETDFNVALHLREAFAVDAEKQTAFVEILSELRRRGFRRDALVEYALAKIAVEGFDAALDAQRDAVRSETGAKRRDLRAILPVAFDVQTLDVFFFSYAHDLGEGVFAEI